MNSGVSCSHPLFPVLKEGPPRLLLLARFHLVAHPVGPDGCTPRSPQPGGATNIGAGSSLSDWTPGCLGINKRGDICSNLAGSRYSGTCWSKEGHHQMTPLSKTTGRNGRQRKPKT